MRVLRLAFLVAIAVSATAQTFRVAEPRIGPAPQRREDVLIAASHEQFLVVWQDGRERWDQTRGRAWAARVSRSSSLLDPTGIPIGTLGHYFPASIAQAVASDGTDFLVVSKYGDTLQFTKVFRDGTTQPAPDLAIPVAYANLVWLGDAYALLYNTFEEPGHLMSNAARALILDRDGHVLIESWPIVASTEGVFDLEGALSGDGSRMLLTWLDEADGRVHARVETTSSVRAGTRTLIADKDPNPLPQLNLHSLAVASSGDRFFLAWSDRDGYLGRVLDLDGVPIGPVITIAASLGNATGTADVVWSGSRFVVAYPVLANGQFSLHISEFSRNGPRLNDENPGTVCSSVAAIDAIDGEALVAWEAWDQSGAARDKIYADHFDSSSNSFFGAQPLLLSRSSALRTAPVGAWLGSNYLAAWSEKSDVTRVAVGRFGADRRPLDGAGVLLGSANASAPALASDGSGALVAWSQPDGAFVAHVDAAGVISPRQISTAAGISGVDVVWNGEEYAACAGSTLVRLGPDGSLRQTAAMPVNVPACQLTWSGSQYLLLWTVFEICFPVCDPPTTLWAQAVSADLTPLGSAVKLATPRVASGPETAVAGDRILVVWTEDQGDERERHVLRARRITHAGLILDAAAFDIGEGAHISDVFAEGENWVVTSGPYAWTVSREGLVSARETRYPFIPEGAGSELITGGPLPLVIFEAPDSGSLVPQLFGRYLGWVRGRAVRR